MVWTARSRLLARVAVGLPFTAFLVACSSAGGGSGIPSADTDAGGAGSAIQLGVDASDLVRDASCGATTRIPAPPFDPDAAVGCAIAIPRVDGGSPDESKINLDYVPGSGGAGEILLQVPDAAHCPTTGLAWHYEDDTGGKMIALCPVACGAARADAKGEVVVVIGCATLGL
jgi:hypothetical protein